MSALLDDTPSTHDDATVRDVRRVHAVKLAFMVASFLSLALSVGLWAMGNEMQAIFVGLWVPSIHSLGTLVLTGEGPAR